MRYFILFISLLPTFLFSVNLDCSVWSPEQYPVQIEKDAYQGLAPLSEGQSCNDIHTTGGQVHELYFETYAKPIADNPYYCDFYENKWDCQRCPAGTEFDDSFYQCLEPCDDNQTRNEAGECVSPPPVCFPYKINYNGVCTSCPTHSHPKDETHCECDVEYNRNSSTGECVKCVPPDYFNTFTNSCDTSNCHEPYIPAPDYSTTFKCIEPLPCPDTLVCLSGISSTPGEWLNIYDVVDCHGIHYATKEKTESSSCASDGQPLPDNPPDDGNGTGDGGGDGSKCEYPPTLYGSPFQGIMTNSECMFDHSGWTFSCPDDSVACYYFDNNSTPPADGDGAGDGDDGNGTVGGTDGNGTGGSMAGVESRLDSVIDSLSAAGAINTSIGDLSNSINNNGKNLGDKLDKIDSDLNNRLAGVNENLGSKLDDLKSAIQDKNLSLDMSESNQYLKDIKDKMYEDHDSDIDDLNTGWDELSTSVDNALASYTTMFDSLSSVIGNTPTPVITAGGSPCPMNVFLYGQDVDFAKGFNLFLTYLKPIMLLILNLSLTYTLIVLSVRAYADITNRVSNIFRS
ncbi:MAG: hypothetical protein P794_05040 [Epsilonproteobacteria bacterium (ex Lamellibrachia satsuma)]|nr:MAG: hypothetical protein P794_05040 [Epsilonproteobacteria bacterium (ex Lamellibrachia satsuma)]